MNSTTARLISVLEDGLRVLNIRDGLRLPEALVSERARNMAMALLGTFEVTTFPDHEDES